ncbi:MAG TPA: prephenate dehydrogenase/arogenate dehydrogenase family protein [Solirubrobacterales bacterium]|nr:prephenate dehydrogenase/arogenate dehydrogenase family protein [Solirubrobacterales bacterium]
MTVVAGGLGAVGGMLRRELAGGLSDVVSIDPRQGVETADVTCPGPLERERLGVAETVILAVPEPVAIEALATLTPLLRPDALLVETLSVKSRFADALTGLRPRFEVVGINPMFGPALQMGGRAVAVVPYNAARRARTFTDLLCERGAQLTELSPSAHDEATAVLQALPHLLMLAYTQAVRRLGVDFEEIVDLAPPPASAILALAARIASGNPHVYSEIQANPHAAEGRATLADELARLSEVCTDPAALQEVLEDVGASLNGSRNPLLVAADHIVSRPICNDLSALG